MGGSAAAKPQAWGDHLALPPGAARRWAAFALVVPALVVVAVFFVIPLALSAVGAFRASDGAFTLAHFERFAGETAKVTLKLPQEGRRRLTGVIARVEGGTITFLVDGAEFLADIDNIDKARLVPDWAALGLAPEKPGKKKTDKPTQKPTADKPNPAE